MELEPGEPAVKLSLTHAIEREPSNFIAAVSSAWPMVISNLKSLLDRFHRPAEPLSYWNRRLD
jgi:hypothetical protein